MNARIAISIVVLLGMTTHCLADESANKSIASAKILLKNKDFDGAKQLLAPVVEQNPENAEAILYLASSEEGLGNIKDALDDYYKSLELLKANPDADAALKKQAQSAANRLDEGRKIVLAHAKQMEQDAAKLKEKNPLAYETVMAAVKMLSGDDVTIAASQGIQAKRHPKDAVEFKGHWYKFFDVPMPWHVAKQKCEEMGGMLACVETKEKHSFITNLCANRTAWVGATDEQKEGDWRWVNGAPIRFSAWLPGEPSNYHGYENVIAIEKGGGWNDEPSDYRMAFICEWEK
jgi:hypothetical protein